MSPTLTFEVLHRTEYRYSRPMVDGYTVAHLLPRDTPHQRVLRAEVVVEPGADEQVEHVDVFGNRVVRLGMHRPHETLEVVARSLVETAWQTDVLDGGDPALAWDEVVAGLDAARGDLALHVAPFSASTAATPVLPGLRELTDGVFVRGRPMLDAVRHLTHEIFAGFAFDTSSTDVTTPLDSVLVGRRGVCQDFAHLGLACLRSVGLAARYVSGYIETVPPPGEPKVVGADASHAWCSVWAPTSGWLDLDPTNDLVPPTQHVTVAWGRDYFDVAPVRGVVIGPPSTQSLTVAVDVTRVAPAA